MPDANLDTDRYHGLSAAGTIPHEEVGRIMNAVIHRCQGAGNSTKEATDAVCEISARLSRARGFISCFVLEEEPGVLTTVSVFEDQASLTEARALFEALFTTQHGHVLSGDLQVTSGEIIFQRGL